MKKHNWSLTIIPGLQGQLYLFDILKVPFSDFFFFKQKPVSVCLPKIGYQNKVAWSLQMTANENAPIW